MDEWVGGLGSWGSVVREFLEGAFFDGWVGGRLLLVSCCLFFCCFFLHHFENFVFINMVCFYFKSISCLYTFGSYFRIVTVVTNRHTSSIVLSISIHL